MIDFDLMVRNILFEVDVTTTTSQPSSTDTNSTPEQQEARNLTEFLTLPINYTELKTLWSNTFNTSLFPFFANETELERVCSNAVVDLPRGGGSGKVYTKFNNIESIFPVLDLIGLLYKRNFKSNLNPQTAPKTYEEFKTKLTEQKQRNKAFKPLDYVPIDAWAQNIKSSYLSIAKDELGKLRLENEPETNSFYQTIFNFLAIRKKALMSRLSNSLRMANGQTVIDDILLKPWNIISGQYAIKDEKLKYVYDQLLVNQMVNLSLACYKLYKQQISTIVGDEKVQKLKLDKDPNYYIKFLGKGQKEAGEVPWPIEDQETNNSYETSHEPEINASMQVASFDQAFELLTRELLDERKRGSKKRKKYPKPQPSSSPDPVDNSSTEPNVDSATASKTASEVEPNETTPEQTNSGENNNLKAFEIETNNFVYSLKNLKQASTNFKIEEASELLEQLKMFANYIKTKDSSSRDIMGGLTQIAKGLSSLGKTMGT